MSKTDLLTEVIQVRITPKQMNSIKKLSSLSVFFPCYNEEKNVPIVINQALQVLPKFAKKFEIIIVDDGSTDSIHTILNPYLGNILKLITLEKNMGKGYAVRTGVLASKYKWILFTDADNSTPIEMLVRLYGYVNEYKFIIGSRNLKDSRRIIKQPFYRSFGGNIFPVLVKTILGIKVKDTQCGFKLIESGIAKEMFYLQGIHGFAFDVELIKNCLDNKIPIKEVAIDWYNDASSKVKFRDMFDMFKTLWRLR